MLAIASAAASAAMSIAGTISATNAQNAAGDAQQKQNAVQAQYIEAARESKVTQAQTQEGLVNVEAWQKDDANAQAARAAQATAATAAGEAGVSGNSVAALQQDYMARSGQFADQVEQNRGASVDRLQMQMQGFDVDAQAATAKLPVPTYGSSMDAALRIGGALARAGTAGYAIYNKTPSSSGYDGYLPPGKGAGATAGDTGGY